jgi:hypothetical protein
MLIIIMLLRLLVMLAYPLVLLVELVVRTLRRGFAPLAARMRHPRGLHGFYSVVLNEFEDFLDEKIDKLMAYVAEIEAHAEQFREIGYELNEISLSGNPFPGVALEFQPCGLSEENAFQALLHREEESVTLTLVVKLLQYASRYRRQYQFRHLTCKRVRIRIGKEPFVQVLYQQMPRECKPADLKFRGPGQGPPGRRKSKGGIRS